MVNRAVTAISPDPQSFVLLKSGLRGAVNGSIGLLTAWDGWVAPLARRWRGARQAADAPPACPTIAPDVDDPVAAITAAPEFSALADFFATIDQAERALVSAVSQAVLYALVRNLRPDNVIEIGTYRAATSKAICRALEANGRGVLHTVDPANSWPIVRLIRRWPPELRKRVCFYPGSSMDFFNLAMFRCLTSELIFVDGNHDYEYALFDIQSAARLVRPGGFVVVDNVSQTGPFFAARDFLQANPAWRECGHCLGAGESAAAFDLQRSTIAGTDMCVLRAPLRRMIGARPQTDGPQKFAPTEINGVALAIARPVTGTLHVQYVVRVREPVMSEETTLTSVDLTGASGPTRVTLSWHFTPDHLRLERTVELWLSWSGDGALELSEPPTLF
jgi:predicted O-methyltransferase YrrM